MRSWNSSLLKSDVGEGEFELYLSIVKLLEGGVLFDFDLTRELLESVLNPWVVVLKNISHDKIVLKEELVGEEVVVGELWGDRWDVKLLHDVVIGFSVSGVAHSVDGVSVKSVIWELGILPDLIEDFLSDWVANGKLIVNFSIVWPDPHWSKSMEVVDKLDFILIFSQNTSHGFGLWFRKGMWSWEALFARAKIVTPEISIVPVDVDTLESIWASYVVFCLELSIHILSLEKELTCLEVVLQDFV